MSKKRIIPLALLVVLMVTILSSCTTFDNFKAAFLTKKGAASDTIKIGVFEPQTGSDSSAAENEIKGIKVANKVYNKVLGKEVELVYGDTQSSLYVAESAIQDLIAKKPVVILGSYGNTSSLVASQYIDDAKIPAISITATNPLITKNNQYYFRVAFSDTSQAVALANYVVNSLNQTKSIVLRVKGDDTATPLISRYNTTMQTLTKDENSVVATIDIDTENKDYSEYLKQIKESKVSTVFMPVSLKVAEKVFEQASEMNMKDVTFIGTKDWHGEELLSLQKKYEGINIAVASDYSTNKTSTTTDNTEMAETFRKEYQKEYGDEEPDEAAALGFDAYLLAINAIEQAGSIDGYLVREKLALTTDFQGASGSITFDQNGDPVKTINVDVIKNGKFKSVYSIK